MVPPNPKIYHLTHIENLHGIFSSGLVLSDAELIRQTPEHHNVGISEIKRRRLEELWVSCNPGTMVGEYVPFYFCPRSIMLYLIYRGNHPDLSYKGGQDSIIYLQADLHRVVDWAENMGRHWAFSDVNAGARYAFFYNSLQHLDRIDWDAVRATDFRDALIKDKKQAEFLLFESFPIGLIESIGAINRSVATSATEIIAATGNTKAVNTHSEWYF